MEDVPSPATVNLPGIQPILLAEVQRLNALQEIASSLLDHNDLDQLFQHCLNLIFTFIPAGRGCLMMLEKVNCRSRLTGAGREPKSPRPIS